MLDLEAIKARLELCNHGILDHALLRTDIPALVAEVERLRAELRELETSLAANWKKLAEDAVAQNERLRAEVERLRAAHGRSEVERDSETRWAHHYQQQAEKLQTEVERLRALAHRAHRVMNLYGNITNWPSEMPGEYADVINELRAAVEVHHAD